MSRRLRPDEVELWQRVAASAAPLHKERPLTAAPSPTSPPKPASSPTPHSPPRLPTAQPGSASADRQAARFTPSVDAFAALEAASPRMDAKAHAKLRRGKLAPEARLDLHGMTLAEARPALTGFILRQSGQGARLVLVITGKGRGGHDRGPLPVRRGALRHAVPEWLAMAPLNRAVLQAVPAHSRHGGQGALYVYLRRHR